jgi:hypothetical protein
MTKALHSCEADRKPGLRVKFLLLLLSLLLQGGYMLLLLERGQCAQSESDSLRIHALCSLHALN